MCKEFFCWWVFFFLFLYKMCKWGLDRPDLLNLNLMIACRVTMAWGWEEEEWYQSLKHFFFPFFLRFSVKFLSLAFGGERGYAVFFSFFFREKIAIPQQNEKTLILYSSLLSTIAFREWTIALRKDQEKKRCIGMHAIRFLVFYRG